jgi:hypothetical protein
MPHVAHTLFASAWPRQFDLCDHGRIACRAPRKNVGVVVIQAISSHPHTSPDQNDREDGAVQYDFVRRAEGSSCREIITAASHCVHGRRLSHAIHEFCEVG